MGSTVIFDMSFDDLCKMPNCSLGNLFSLGVKIRRNSRGSQGFKAGV